MTPINNPQSQQEKKYNQLQIRARNTIERAFGVLKSRFRCLSKARSLQYGHEKSADIIYACGCLHNFLVSNGIYPDELEISEDLPNEETLFEGEVSANNIYLREARRLRENYINTL